MKPPGLRFRSGFGEYLNSLKLHGVGVEVGVFTGLFSEQILESWKGSKLWLVDPWRHLDDYLDSYRGSNAAMKRRYGLARRRLNRFRRRIGWIRERSEVAVRRFRPRQLDFVYIDANHSYRHAIRDIGVWYSKLKRGGVLAGHDYFDALADADFEPIKYGKHPRQCLTSYGVKSAVDDFTKKRGLPFSVTAEKYPTWYLRKR